MTHRRTDGQKQVTSIDHGKKIFFLFRIFCFFWLFQGFLILTNSMVLNSKFYKSKSKSSRKINRVVQRRNPNLNKNVLFLELRTLEIESQLEESANWSSAYVFKLFHICDLNESTSFLYCIWI